MGLLCLIFVEDFGGNTEWVFQIVLISLGCFMFLNGSLEFILELWKPWVLDWPNGHCGKFWNFFLYGLF
jgi:hypothetical protein